MSAASFVSNLPTLNSERGLSRYLAAINAFPLLSAEDEKKYLQRLTEQGDREAAYHLVTSHLRLAAKIALRYRGYGLPVSDLISEANVGLMLAVKRFNPEKGVRLATYAIWWIKATIQEYILRSWSLVKIGTTPAQKKLFFNLRKLKSRIAGAEEVNLAPEHVNLIAEKLKVAPREVIEMNGRMRGDVTLNLPLNREENGEEAQDLLIDAAPDPEGLFVANEDRCRTQDALSAALGALSPRERQILEDRFLREQPSTLDELAATFKVSRERIRQIEARALQKMKIALGDLREAS